MRTVDIYRGDKQIARAIDAGTFFLRLRGLLGRGLSRGEGLILTPCDQIHTFGMKYPIDVVYLDSAGLVLEVEAAVPEGKACRRVKGARSVLELFAGEAERLEITKGDVLKRK